MPEPDTRAATMGRYITATRVLVHDIATVIAGCPGYGVSKDGCLLIDYVSEARGVASKRLQPCRSSS